MCGLVSLPAAKPVVGPLTYLVLRANAGSKSSLLQVVPKSKHANISNQRRFRLTDATIRSSPDWNKDNPMLTLCCSRKRRRSPTPTAKTGCQVYLARSGQGSPPLSWAGASVSFSVLVKAILRAEMPSALFRAVSPFPHVKSSRLKAAQRRMISKGRHLLLELVPKGQGDLTLALRSA
jgi:hypothetical protein